VESMSGTEQFHMKTKEKENSLRSFYYRLMRDYSNRQRRDEKGLLENGGRVILAEARGRHLWASALTLPKGVGKVGVAV